MSARLKTVGANRWCAQSMTIWFGSTVPLSINYSAGLCSVSCSLIISCHWLLDWYPAGYFSSPPSSPFYLSGTLRDIEENRGRGRKGKKPSRQIEAERARGDGMQRNMRLLSKNTSLSVSLPSILMRVHKMQECTSHARAYTQTYTLQGQPACVFASTHFHSRWGTLWWQGQQ